MTMIRMKLNQARNIQRISIIELVSCSDKGTVFFLQIWAGTAGHSV